MFIRRQIGSVVSVALLCAAGALAQQNSPQAPLESRVYLDVVAAPKSGPLVGSLQQQDFTLLDNNNPQPITSFEAMTGQERSIQAVVVIDAINSSHQTVGYAVGQIDKFLRSKGGQLEYPVAIASATDGGAQMIAGFSSDGNELSAALDKSDIGIGRTKFGTQYSGSERVQFSLQALSRLVAIVAPRPGRKVILWVSPGWPMLTSARAELSAAQVQQIFHDVVYLSTLLRQAEVTLYSVDPLGSAAPSGVYCQEVPARARNRGGANSLVPLVSTDCYREDFTKGVSKPSQVEGGDLALQVLAIQSGGLAIGSNNDVAGLLRQCLSDAAPYYEISFDSPPAEKPDTYHDIEIKIAKPGLVARTREGYYAQPAPHN